MTLEEYLQNNSKTHLIFDFDETLCKLILPWEHWEDRIRDKLIKLDNLIYENYKREKISFNEMVNQYVLKFGKRAKQLIIDNSVFFETNLLKEIKPNKELLEFVRNSINYKLFIWSSNTRLVIEKALNEFGIKNKFGKIVTEQDVNLIKPDAEGFKNIYDSSVSKEKYLLVGNGAEDKRAAEKMGVEFFLVDYFKE